MINNTHTSQEHLLLLEFPESIALSLTDDTAPISDLSETALRQLYANKESVRKKIAAIKASPLPQLTSTYNAARTHTHFTQEIEWIARSTDDANAALIKITKDLAIGALKTATKATFVGGTIMAGLGALTAANTGSMALASMIGSASLPLIASTSFTPPLMIVSGAISATVAPVVLPLAAPLALASASLGAAPAALASAVSAFKSLVVMASIMSLPPTSLLLGGLALVSMPRLLLLLSSRIFERARDKEYQIADKMRFHEQKLSQDLQEIVQLADNFEKQLQSNQKVVAKSYKRLMSRELEQLTCCKSWNLANASKLSLDKLLKLSISLQPAL